jgi:hypothetical protein
MTLEWIATAAGLVAGAVALAGLYVLAKRKATKTGERAGVVFVWALSFLALVHGLGLCLVTAAVWGAVALFVDPLPESERQLMGRMILAGLGSVCIGALGLQVRRRPAAGNPTP